MYTLDSSKKYKLSSAHVQQINSRERIQLHVISNLKCEGCDSNGIYLVKTLSAMSPPIMFEGQSSNKTQIIKQFSSLRSL